jgi:hypothetical protein
LAVLCDRVKNLKGKIGAASGADHAHGAFALGEKFAAKGTHGAVAATGGAVLAARENDAQVERVPMRVGEKPFQVVLGAFQGGTIKLPLREPSLSS